MCELAGGETDHHPILSLIVDEELATIALLAAIEVLAVESYETARHAAVSGDLGAVPPALAQYLDAGLQHHQVALRVWNEALARHEVAPVTEPPAALAQTVNGELATAGDTAGVAGVVLSLEQSVAGTYHDALTDLVSGAGALLAGSILAIDRQHVAVLLFMAGRYSAPDTLAT